MKKISIFLLAFVMLSTLVLPVMAEGEDYSDTEAWYQRCSQPQTDEAGVTACEGFQAYQNERKEALAASITEFSSSIDNLSSETAEMEARAKEQQELAAALQQQIEEKQVSIASIQENIAQTQVAIDEKQAEIDVWDGQIKDRMKSEQVSTGTNALVDLIMGSKSLPDLLRRMSGIERITASDQDQIEQLNQMKEELEFSRSELMRLNDQLNTELQDLEDQQAQAQELEASYQRLVEEYQKQIADLEAAKRNAQADMDAIKDFVITTAMVSSIDYSIIPTSSGFINPVPDGRATAGTWAYNSGGLHLGIDRAAPVGSPLLAPADGLIIYTSNSAASNGGYLGNWTGHPAGSGNCIEMLTNVNGTTYAISFFHLSSDFYVSVGQTVSQGQLLALTGNSGNSSGAHTHIEVYNLGSMSIADAAAQFAANGDTAFGTGWGTTSTACEVKGSAPCRERPENFF